MGVEALNAAFLYILGYLDVHTMIELALAVVIAVLLMQKAYPNEVKRDRLSPAEIEELIRDWEPEPLVPPSSATPSGPGSSSTEIENVLTSAPRARALVDGRSVVNFTASNPLGFSGREDTAQTAEEAIKKYGCGSCGPRGFYGTIDVHLKLEEKLAHFVEAEAAIIYSYDMATAASVIPAFAKKGDLLVIDEACQFSIMQGASLSRSRVIKFKHNDVADLRRVLEKVRQSDTGDRAMKQRRFIVVEGIYYKTGARAPLDHIVKLKNEFKYRLIVEDSIGFGILGTKGRGCIEEFNLEIAKSITGINDKKDAELASGVDMLIASLGTSLGTVGGFCAGCEKIVDHQRLSGLGYVFSASLPPFLAAAGVLAVDLLENDTTGDVANKRKLLSRNIETIRGELEKHKSTVTISGYEKSYVILLELGGPVREWDVELQILTRIRQRCLEAGVYLGVFRMSALEHWRPPRPHLRLQLMAEHTSEDIAMATKVIVRQFEAQNRA